MTENPFDTAEAWSPSVTLKPGIYVCDTQVEDGGEYSTGNNRLVVRCTCSQGLIEDRIPYGLDKGDGPFLAKAVGYIKAAGAPKPEPGRDFDPERNYKFSPSYIQTLSGRRVTVVVGEEQDQNDVDKYWARVDGYLPAHQGADAQADSRGLPQAGQQARPNSAAVDQDIPF